MKRFWDKVEVNIGGCWLWTAHKTKNGYGTFQLSDGPVRAHRMSYVLNKGEIPDGVYVCHSCDNPSCVNPDHLFLGSPQDNQDDMVRKGRQAKGEHNGAAKLTSNDVREIRAMYAIGIMRTDIAKMYPVSITTICDIVKRKWWRHV